MKEGSAKIKTQAQAVAVGLSKARKAGIPVPENPNRGKKRRTA